MKSFLGNPVILALFLFLSPANTFSQTPVVFSNPGGPGTNGNNGSGTTVDITSSPSVPFDGGLSFLLLGSGIAYIGKKLKGGLQFV